MIDSVLKKYHENQTFPGVVLLIEKSGKIVKSSILGDAQTTPKNLPMKEETLFDLASVTKSLATTTTFLALCELNAIGFDKTAGYFIPELNTKTGALSLFQLMTHTSGLPPIPGIFTLFKTADEVDMVKGLSHLYSLIPDQTPGTGVIYSCTGYIILTRILEKVAGCSLSKAFADLITTPGNLNDLFFNPKVETGDRERCAATEYCSWRGRMVKGEVHDENSFCFNGEGGNAGLFGTAKSVMDLLNLFTSEGVLNRKQLLSPENIIGMTTCQTPDFSPKRALGFLTQDTDSLAGPGFSNGAFGHTGFTGTSVWVDPEMKLKVVTLTNRVHFGRDNTAEKIKLFRRELHQAILKEFSE
ncbi:MAG: beta-lactamase family protein [Spirochaetales bacterium]|nr:beta-lactamase family protein [Spirochaetales bacterium]